MSLLAKYPKQRGDRRELFLQAMSSCLGQVEFLLSE